MTSEPCRPVTDRSGRGLLADLRYVERVGVHGAPIETFASFVVEDGRPGAVRI
jgi:hypothetical protein